MEWHGGLITILSHWKCPKCYEGDMIYMGSCWPTASPGWHHKCNKCEHCAAIHFGKFPILQQEEDL